MIDQLIYIYENFEPWHKTKLSRKEAYKYFEKLIEKGRIIWHTSQESIVGYVESWRINYEQFGRIICKAPFSAYTEDVETGNISYVANCWCHPDYRRTNVYKIVRNAYFEQNKDCEYFVGEARRKRTGLIKVFKRSEIHINKEEYHGVRKNDTGNATRDYCTANA